MSQYQRTDAPEGFYQELKTHPQFKSIAFLLFLMTALSILGFFIAFPLKVFFGSSNTDAVILITVISQAWGLIPQTLLLLIAIKLREVIWGRIAIVLIAITILVKLGSFIYQILHFYY